MSSQLLFHLIDEDYGPAWKCSWALINLDPSLITNNVWPFLSRHCDPHLLDQILHKSLLTRDEHIQQVFLFLSFFLVQSERFFLEKCFDCLHVFFVLPFLLRSRLFSGGKHRWEGEWAIDVLLVAIPFPSSSSISADRWENLSFLVVDESFLQTIEVLFNTSMSTRLCSSRCI